MPFTFDAIQAFDPTDPRVVAANADVIIHLPGDPDMVPLEITDTTGVPLPNPYRTNDLGAMPSFIAPVARVAWTGGELSGFLTSFEALKDEALAAAASAQASLDAIEAEIATHAGSVDAAVASAAAAAESAEAAAALVGAPTADAVATAIGPGGGAEPTLADQIAARSVAKVGATTVYVNKATGSDAGPGTSAAPLRTVQEAVNRAQAVAMASDAVWTVSLAAGTYTERVRYADFTPFALNIKIQGPDVGGHPNVPTAIFSEGAGGVSAAAFKSENPNLRHTYQDIKFIGYNGTSSSQGINNANGSLWTVNVHAENCFYGISSQHGSMDVAGGILNNNGRLPGGGGSGAAIRSLFLNRHSIGNQNASTLAGGPIITNNRMGVYAQESCTGHVDYCTFEGNETGALARVNSRLNLDGSSFKRNITDVSLDSNSHAYIPESVVFGTGADKSTQTVDVTSGSEVTSPRIITPGDPAFSRTERAFRGIYTAQTVSQSTVEKDILNLTLRAPIWGDGGRFIGAPPKRIRVQAAGTLEGSGGTKTLRLRLGASIATVAFTASETGTFLFDGAILFTGSARQVMTAEGRRHLGGTMRNYVSARAEDMTADKAVRFTAQTESTADSITVEYVELSWG